MTWLVDTCVLIDVAIADPRFGEASARHLQRLLGDGLAISPVTYAELAPVFDGSVAVEEEFLATAGVRFDEPWTREDTLRCHAAWAAYVTRRRQRAAPRPPIAGVLIGAMACRHDGLVTRNPDDFAPLFPELRISDPTAHRR